MATIDLHFQSWASLNYLASGGNPWPQDMGTWSSAANAETVNASFATCVATGSNPNLRTPLLVGSNLELPPLAVVFGTVTNIQLVTVLRGVNTGGGRFGIIAFQDPSTETPEVELVSVLYNPETLSDTTWTTKKNAVALVLDDLLDGGLSLGVGFSAPGPDIGNGFEVDAIYLEVTYTAGTVPTGDGFSDNSGDINLILTPGPRDIASWRSKHEDVSATVSVGSPETVLRMGHVGTPGDFFAQTDQGDGVLLVAPGKRLWLGEQDGDVIQDLTNIIVPGAGGLIRDEFSGDGVVDSFGLTSPPVGQVMILVDAVLQQPTTHFEIGSASLQLDFAPASGARIECYYATVSSRLICDTFTGDGSTDLFELSEDPSANAVVMIDNVSQLDATFSLSYPLAFTYTPANGSEIEAIYLASTPGLKRDSFTADGATTGFTLTAVPNGAVFVFVDGITQVSPTFARTDQLITFDFTPANGAIIEVFYT